MKFRCEREALAEAMIVAGRATSGRSTAHPHQGLRFNLVGDRLTITGTGDDLTIQVAFDVAGEINGSTHLVARLSSDIVRSMPSGRVEFVAGDEEVLISNGRSKFTLRPLNQETYPVLTAPSTNPVSLPAADFGDALRQVVRAAKTEDLGEALSGVLLTAENNGLRMVATDSYRLAMRDLAGSEVPVDQRVVMPSRALGELQRLLSSGEQVLMSLGEQNAMFEVGNVTLTTRLVEKEFPNYRPLLQHAHTGVLTVEREALLDAIKRVRIFASDVNAIRMHISTDSVKLSASDRNQGDASEEIDAQFAGEPLDIAFNHDYLAAGVEACKGEHVTISTINSQKPAIVRGVGNDDYLYLLMPVRMS